MNILLESLPVFMLIFCRITSFFVFAPVLSSKGVPNMFKIGMSFFLSVLVFLTYGIHHGLPADMTYILLIIREILIGLVLGFVAYLLFMVIQTAGAFIDIQVGFGIVNVIDPMTGSSAPVLGNLKYMFAILLFLTMNGHHYLLDGIIRSYDWVPLSNDFFMKLYSGSISEFLLKTFGQSFVLAFQMAAPIVASLFLTDIGLGFLARTAPQFNVFVIGMPLKLIVGLVVLLLLVPSFSYVFGDLFNIMFESMQNLLGIMGHRPT
ncbi:flagellar biosynthetic protein FliR [Paenibacillus sp.]|jgi:flagellar biosynthetic protein FliR|uniref:flagellar biosynthetic protein FliR n=1 Tax=Paenibacillus sp. TaxID=58172 RepID=UPI002824FC8A|nr:flagellar biosynthetic protein FliR [Paenibacillus sp.]MDR0270067.1 flagellar type III secretion system protein FliR [Paenibacillus sp.]